MGDFTKTFYRNSNLKINRYFAKPKFRSRLIQASKLGKDIFYNEVRKLNNCYVARKEQGDIYIKDIFSIYWKEFKEKYLHRLQRPGLIKTIEDMISCHNFDNGYLFYECPNCNQFYMIGFSCHSRFCPSCGQKYKRERTIKVSEKCLDVPHRQLVFTIPSQLRKYFQMYHSFLNVLFTTVKETLNACLEKDAPKLYKNENRRLGFISFLHTFGRDLKFHPHIHVLIAERYSSCNSIYKRFSFFPYEYLRITFQNKLFHNIYIHARDNIKSSKLSQTLYKLCQELKKKYPSGYYFFGPQINKDETTIRDIKSLTNYIARYASHPPISERRIIKLDTDNNTVTWYYDPHEDDDIKEKKDKLGRKIITEDVFSFMGKLIKHIPDKGFQLIRYYGFYSNAFIARKIPKKLFTNDQLFKMLDNNKWVNSLKLSFGYDPTLCECGHQMHINFELSYFP